jgi:hypothetical protein
MGRPFIYEICFEEKRKTATNLVLVGIGKGDTSAFLGQLLSQFLLTRVVSV